MKFTSLASSSHGNAYLVSDNDTRILIECGVPYRTLQRLSGFTTGSLAACLISHEHKDHSGCVRDLVSAGLPVYMSAGTADVLELADVNTVGHGEQFQVGSMDIVPFDTFHNAREPLGFLIKSRIDRENLVFAVDTVNLAYRFPGVNILAIEANYEKERLDSCERLPEKVRYRIEQSHMEIQTLCRYLQTLDLSQCREIHLLHLSAATSRENHFVRAVYQVVPPTVKVYACQK